MLSRVCPTMFIKIIVPSFLSCTFPLNTLHLVYSPDKYENINISSFFTLSALISLVTASLVAFFIFYIHYGFFCGVYHHYSLSVVGKLRMRPIERLYKFQLRSCSLAIHKRLHFISLHTFVPPQTCPTCLFQLF